MRILLLATILLVLSACEPSPYIANKIKECIDSSNRSPEAIKACGAAYGYGK